MLMEIKALYLKNEYLNNMKNLNLVNHLSSTLSFQKFFETLVEQIVDEGSFKYFFRQHLLQELQNHPEWLEEITINGTDAYQEKTGGSN
jgi:hypothetical protein